VIYRVLADVTMIVHFAFILAVALGGFAAWRWPRVIWVHLATVAWGAGIVTIGWDCPLTPLERGLRERGGEQGYEEGWGFVDNYIEGVIYPSEYTPHLRVLAGVLIAVSWAGYLLWFRPGRSDRQEGPGDRAEGTGNGTPAGNVRSG
jgi:hypothetical protein